MSPPAHLYHVTFLHSLDSIASRGLRPGAGQTFGGGYAGHSRGRVFLTEWDGVSFWMSKYEDMAHHHTDNPEEGWVPVCLKVSTRGLDLEPDPAGSRDAYADSYFTTESISPRQIQVWHGGWKAVGSVDTEEMQDEVMEAAEEDADETGTWYEVDFEMFEPARKAASRLPGWLQRGKPVPDVSRRSRNADFILEGDEWDWEWREVEIPFSLFGREFKRLTGWGAKDEDERDESIRTWMQRSGGPRKALQQSPILAMWDGGNLELLDGAHRIRIAQELGEDQGTVLVGIEPAGNGRLASSYAPAADRRGEPLAPGDYVSFRTYPRGTKKGWVTISQKWTSDWRDEEGQRHTSPALAIVTEDGTVYDLSPKGTTKLRKQVPPPASVRTAGILEAPPAMVREITAWARQVYADGILGQPNIDPKVVRILRPFSKKPVAMKYNDIYKRQFPFDLEGWRYLDRILEGMLEKSKKRLEQEGSRAQEKWERQRDAFEKAKRLGDPNIDAVQADPEEMMYSVEWTEARMFLRSKGFRRPEWGLVPPPPEPMVWLPWPLSFVAGGKSGKRVSVPARDTKTYLRTRLSEVYDALIKGLRLDRWLNVVVHAGRIRGAGSWDAKTKTLSLSLHSLPGKSNDRFITIPETPEDARDALESLRQVVRHELQHAAQDFMKSVLNLQTEGGLPPKAISEPERKYEWLTTMPEYHSLHDLEFYTDLQDEVDKFKRWIKTMPEEGRRDAFQTWVGVSNERIVNPKGKYQTRSHFFRSLKDHAPGKWRKALAEFYKAVARWVPGARMATDSKDKTNYVPMQDRLGKPLYPGDFVRIKLFACNPVEGWVTVSQSYVSDCFEDDGERIWAPRLEVVTKDNTPYKLISNRTTKLSPQVPPPSTVTIHKQATAVLLPLMSPRYNLREMMKQIALLEDHLAHPEKQCDDCIQKHFLTIEALAEEAATLDTAGQFPGLAQIPIEIRKLEGRWIDGDTRRALEWLRSFRKLVTPMVFDIRKASMTTATLIGCVTNGNRLVGCSDRLDTACDPQNWPQYGRQLFDLWLYRDIPIDLAEKLVDHGYGYFHQGGFQFQTDHDAWKAAEPYAALDEPLIPMGTELTEEFLALVQQAVQNPARLASVSSLLDAQNRTIERIGAMRNRTARSEEYYLGDDDAGVYWTVDERGDAYYLNAWVDAEHFTEDLIKNDGPYESEYAAAESGHGAAVEWCLDNDVPLSRREMVFEGWLKANRRVFSTPRRASAHRIAEHWIQDAIKRPGRVREYLGIPKGETIPMADLESAIDRLKMKARRTPEETSLLRALYLARTLKTRFH